MEEFIFNGKTLFKELGFKDFKTFFKEMSSSNMKTVYSASEKKT